MERLDLVLARHTPSPRWTLGSMYGVGLGLLCFTVEDCDRLSHGQEKVPGATAIPCGEYEVILNNSPKYGKTMPRVLDVPGFTGILLHPGNVPEDTAGCILPVTTLGAGSGGQSRAAFYKLVRLIRDHRETWLRVLWQVDTLDLEDDGVPVVAGGGQSREAWHGGAGFLI